MSATLEIMVRAQDMASDVLEGVQQSAGQAGEFIERNWKQATVALGAAGVALEGMARKQQDTTVQVKNLASATGMQEKEVRELATSMSNATFPLDEVLGLMELGRQRGLEGADALRNYAEFWDMVGDATGESSQMLAESGVVLQRFGIAAGNEAEALGAFGFVTRETTSDVGGFMGMMERVARELPAEAMPSVNDMAAALGALEDAGIAGSRGQRELQRALRESGGDLDAALESLGVTNEAFRENQRVVSESGDVIEEQAGHYQETRTVMQRMQSGLEDLMFRYAGFTQAASALAPVLIGLGPVSRIAVGAIRGVGAALSFVAANPIVLIIGAIVALVAGLVWLWKNNETFRNIVMAVWNAVGRVISSVWEGVIQPVFRALVGFVQNVIIPVIQTYWRIWQRVFEGVAAVAQWAWRNVISPVINGIVGAVQWLVNTARGLAGAWGSVWAGMGNAVRAIARPIANVLNGIIGGVERAINAIARGINRIPSVSIPSWVPGIGGRSFSLPTIPSVSLPRVPSFHTGGIFRAGPGQRSGLAELLDGERVLPPGQAAGTTIVFAPVFNASIVHERDVTRWLQDRFAELKQEVGELGIA